MESVKLVVDPNFVLREISRKREELRTMPLTGGIFSKWRSNVSDMLGTSFSSQSIRSEFLAETAVFFNKFSSAESTVSLRDAADAGEHFLVKLEKSIEFGQYRPAPVQPLHTSAALQVIRNLLRNFYKHIEEMYQADVHGSGSIRKEDLDKITIGNEYDVQRILYSLIRPIFPEARLEAAGDAGYQAVRYDIVMAEYNIVIEVKCTRDNMTERKLIEELGSDAFHYRTAHLFLFIFDRVKLIRNPDAFEKSFNREKADSGKDIETFVVQEVHF